MKKEKHTKKELEAELEGEAVQEFSQGETITTGVYIITPKPYVRLPKVEAIGMEEPDGYLLAVPLDVLEGQKSPLERRYELRKRQVDGRDTDGKNISGCGIG